MRARLGLVPPRPGDLVAGLSVALLLIPQSLAYAELAGLPAEHGIYAAALPPVLAALASSSPYLQTGPVALTSLLTLGALANLAHEFTPEYVALAALLALIVGTARLAVGFLRGGVIAYLMSQPVVSAFTIAAAILIAASQVPAIFGVPVSAENPVVGAGRALGRPGDWNWTAITLAASTLVVVGICRRLHPLVPGVLIAAALAIGFSEIFDYSGSTVGDLPTGFPPLSLDLPWSSTLDLLVPGLVIALIGFSEPAAIARRFATADRRRWDPNREFIGQGLANVAAGLSGGYPVGGSFSRTALNKLAGARTRWSGAITGLVVLAFLPFLGVISALPRCVLGALVVAAVAPLIEFRTLRTYLRFSPVQFAIGLATFAATIGFAPRVQWAVVVGVVLAIGVHLWRELDVGVTTRVEGSELHLVPRGVLYFVSAPRLEDTVTHLLEEHPGVDRLVLHLDGLGRVDLTGALALKTFVDNTRAAGVTVTLVDVPAQSQRIFERVLGSEPG